MLTDLNGKFVVVAITRDETRIWLSDASRGTAPEVITRPKHDEAHRHVREAQANHGHNSNHGEREYLEQISSAIAPAADVLVVSGQKGPMVVSTGVPVTVMR